MNASLDLLQGHSLLSFTLYAHRPSAYAHPPRHDVTPPVCPHSAGQALASSLCCADLPLPRLVVRLRVARGSKAISVALMPLSDGFRRQTS
eukprot:COSAG01_NODE_1853_length_9060_cov_13.741576_15_plen_91_part_00